MTTFLQFAVIGLATGAVYALLAQGAVLVYRASGIVNFAQAAFAVIAGFLFAQLTQDSGWSVWPAFAVLTLAGALLGAAVYWGAIRPLRSASQLTQVIATLAVLLIAQGAATLKWGATSVLVSPFLSDSVVNVGDVAIGVSQIILVAIATALTFALWAGMRFTLPGIAIRAVAENRRATAALGWSPDVLATSSWAIAGMLGAAAGMLIAPATGVQVNQMTLLLVATMAAALVGSFSSFPITLLGALLIGVAQAEVSNYVDVPGAADALPFLAIVVILTLRGRGLPTRGHVAEQFAELGTGWVKPRVVVGVSVVLALLILFVFSGAFNAALTASLVFATVLLSIVVLTGYAGQLSLAQMAFAGIGALVAGRLVQEGLAFPLAALAGVLVTIPIGLVFALPALRTRGMTLAIVTLGLGSAVSYVVFANGDIIGGIVGTQVGSQSILGLSIDSSAHPERYALLVLIVFVLCMVAVSNVRRSRVGRRMLAVRANERAAAALGINVYSAKLYAFGLSSAIAAVAGILLGFQFQTIVYDVFDPFQSILAAGYGVIGGVGYVSGALQGAPLAPSGVGTWLADLLGTNAQKYVPFVGGVLLLLMMLQNPNGLANGGVKMMDGIRERRARKRGPAPPPPPLPRVESRPVRPATLEVKDLVVRFGGVVAVNGVTLSLQPGKISGLIGPNGAGKTTVIDAITGFVKPAAGTVLLDGTPIERLSTYKRARAGVTRSFQALELFEGISVRENLLTASEDRDAAAYVTNLAWPGKRPYSPAALAAIQEFGLEDDLEKLPSELPYGRRRLVAIARAMAAEPSVLLLDEPGAGLDETEAAELATLVRGLATRWGIATLLIEHDMAFVMSVCDDITVLDFGRQIAHGTPDEISRDRRVIAAYLGESDDGADEGAADDAAAVPPVPEPTTATEAGGQGR
jgi:ABC-type branched-subunit amino acid transport system ATPase component/branched-subunit amino acid ABC-type transport system permease component